MLVQGVGVQDHDCRGGICQHNENTDLVRFKGALFLVHRTAESQVLGPNSSLRISKSTDEGKTFSLQAILPAPSDRDIRDPHFYLIGDQLYLKALARLPVTSSRDSNVDSVSLGTRSPDGVIWEPFAEIGPHGWSFWRLREKDGICYTAAYQDGDKAVDLYRSPDGRAFTRVSQIWGAPEDTPLETELLFMPDGRLLALVRVDGTDEELFGTDGRLRTKVCWAAPPYDSFSCAADLQNQRLDGPLGFFWRGRMLVVARKHLGKDARKRTAVYELTGTQDLAIRELVELPSAGDTAYAGGVELNDGRVLLSWYSSDRHRDPDWAFGMLTASDIWTAVLDPSRLP